MPLRQVSFRLPDDVLAWLKRQGEENLRSMAAEVAMLVRAEMKCEQKTKRDVPAAKRRKAS